MTQAGFLARKVILRNLREQLTGEVVPARLMVLADQFFWRFLLIILLTRLDKGAPVCRTGMLLPASFEII